jgi:hypothetical protein
MLLTHSEIGEMLINEINGPDIESTTKKDLPQ